MPRISFTAQLATGIKAIDNDHRMLIDIVNALHDEIDSQAHASQVDSALAALIRYVEEHFAREEKIMEACRYTDLASHMKLHQNLAQTVYSLLRLFRTEPEKIVWAEVQAFLNQWLINHISKCDMAYVPAVRNFTANQTAEAPPSLQAVTVRVPPDQVDLIFRCASALADGGDPARMLADTVNSLASN
jgi:hemerythrin